MTDQSSAALTALILAVFRLNGDLLIAGDRLVAELGLTSARWQVLGAVALSPVALSVAQLARTMGLTRQAVQRLVTDMAGDGLVVLTDNPHHRRARLVCFTDRGRAVYDAAMARQAPWAATLVRGIDPTGMAAAAALLGVLRDRLAVMAEDGSESEPESAPESVSESAPEGGAGDGTATRGRSA